MEAAGLSIDRRQLLEGAEGWTAWHFKIKVMLRAAGLLDIVDGTLKPPEDKSEIEKWEFNTNTSCLRGNQYLQTSVPSRSSLRGF
ncbi:hypothetical protein JYU34_007040 [Plutella xylostella]|uniref:Uncharacterized protein n=1 Tax=Plutella xylostella TaxID=51655 RepID=A0ABQ7QPF5_PLUXY|nr:hypothetical protein JYU34_007040 [Plutella xylostella]